ncbi:MAG: RNA-binding S4 domain-containing protein [Thermoanaerobaculia bacterium]|nr:RNA-binding S4 domain-containing protein [Thermoanaerobaculia bacterium]
MKKRKEEEKEADPGVLSGVRLDVFLDVACLFPTRSRAQAACDGGKVDVNGSAARPHKIVKIGDAVSITFEHGRRQFVIRGLAEKHIKKQEARALFEDVTPPPSPEVLEAKRLERLFAPRQAAGDGKLSHRERRERDRLRGR